MTVCFRIGRRPTLLVPALLLVLLVAPVSGHAFSSEDPDGDGFVLMPAQKRYYALPNAHSAPQTLRSDADRMKRGFMRIDRSPIHTVRRVASAPAPQVIRPQARPELELIRQLEADLDKQQRAATAAKQQARRADGKITHAWPLPVQTAQYISSGYGVRKDPFNGRQAFHGGLDIAAAPNTPILATADGVVKEAGRRAGFGNSVLLRHADGSETMYNHLAQVAVRVGMQVQSGQMVGRLGSTGRSTGPHLDYRISVAGRQIDPMRVLAGKQPTGTQFARNQAPARAEQAYPNVRTQNGVRVVTPRLTPQQRVAMGGGFIRVQ